MARLVTGERSGRPLQHIQGARLLGESEWRAYGSLLRAMNQHHMAFAVGGGIAYSLYAHRWRNTRDIDLYVRPNERHRFIEMTMRHGFNDMHEREPYDRRWIFRGRRGDAIVDVIWQMANQRAVVDEGWLFDGARFEVEGVALRLIPPEELIFAKLYVLQRDRCDWPDLLSVLHAQAEHLDWQHLLQRVEDDRQLLAALLCTFHWLAPDRARAIPAFVWRQLDLEHRPRSMRRIPVGRSRADLLDARPWFGPSSS